MKEKDFASNIKREKDLLCGDGKKPLHVFSVSPVINTDELAELALHIRRQYAIDEMLKSSADFHGISENDYIDKYLLPNPLGEKPSPSTASGEFGEIICSDILENFYFYKVPRLKLINKSSPDMPAPLIDIVGYKINDDYLNDVLCLAEVKTALFDHVEPVLCEAYKEANGSKKARNLKRMTKTLELYWKNAKATGDKTVETIMERFVQRIEKGYTIDIFACAVERTNECPKESNFKIDFSKVPNDIKMFYVYGPNLKDLEIALFTWYRK